MAAGGTDRNGGPYGQLQANKKESSSRVLGVVQDITERRQAEAKINDFIKRLKESNDELEHFAYIASHDLRAPLRAISHLAQWVSEDCEDILPEQSKDHLATLQRRIQRLDNMLEGLLQYSRVGRVKEEIKTVSLGKVVDDIKSLMDIPPHCSIHCVGPLPTFQCQEVPLSMVLRNLIENAIKHRAGNAQTVVISCKDNGAFYEISVTDDGPGIPKDQHEKIFGLFTTLKSRDQLETSGLGLAIVKKAIKYQGGTINVYSNDNMKGVTFTFTWPKKPVL